MKVLHFTNLYPSASNPDRGTFIFDQIESLRAAGVECDVWVIDKERNGFRDYFKGALFLLKNWRSYEVIHAHHLFCGVIAILSGARSRLVTSLLSDGHREAIFRWEVIGKVMYWLVSRFSCAVICKVTPKTKRNGVFFVENGVDFSRFSKRNQAESRRLLNLKVDGKYALFVASQKVDRPEKRYDLFQKIIEQFNRRYGLVVEPLIMSGVPPDKVPHYYAAADVYLLCSDFEGSPNAVKEALASGCPVVGRSVGTVPVLLQGVPACGVYSELEVEKASELLRIALAHKDRHEIVSAFSVKGLAMSDVAERVKSVYAYILSPHERDL